MAENPYRLSRNVEPDHYEITLTPDLSQSRFTGEERISVIIHNDTSEIQLNALALDILNATMIDDDGIRISCKTNLDQDREVLTLVPERSLTAGEYVLHLTFAGVIGDRLAGFYKSTYTDSSGEQKVIGTTQFQATDARRAFPCWDEPDFKATFGITLIVDEHLTAVSNSPVIDDQSLGNGKRQVTFEDTMKMSTYLVAWVVGELAVTDPIDVDGIPLRVACVPGREHLAEFSLTAGAKALRYFTDYFQIPYPADKLDFIGLPDFAAGAMENLGCVTYRETALLVDTQRASRLEVQRVADVVGHETAHMWFGDLVTMKWWNGIWLNEAFATFMEMLFVDNMRPDWERWSSFGIEKAAAMSIDSLSTTRPIEYEVIKPDDAHGMFDLLTYKKGGSVLRMLEQYLGAREFATGISAYLNKHAHGNAETSDLWDALEESSNQPVRSMMDTWIFQGGHPIIHLEVSDANTLLVSQKQFRYQNPEIMLWHVPVTLRASINNEIHHFKFLLTKESQSLQLPDDPDWIVVNEHANGFYRASYSSSLFAKLMSNISALDSLERFSLASDMWAACLSGSVDLTDVIKLAEVMKNDDDPNVWGAILSPLRSVDSMLDDAQRDRLHRLVSSITLPQYDRLGWVASAGESEQTSTLRATIIAAAGVLGASATVRTAAFDKYNEYLKDPSSLDSNLVGAVEQVLASTNSVEHYERMLNKFSSDASTPQEKINALRAMASFTEPALVDRTLELILNGTVRSQDGALVLAMMLMRHANGARVWEWCEQHWSFVLERFPESGAGRIIEGFTGHTDPDVIAQVSYFLETHPVPQAQLSVAQTLERLQVNLLFRNRYIERLDSII